MVETLRKAIAWRQELDAGEVASQADIARREGVARARGTQVMGLLRLASEIQQHILSVSDVVRWPSIRERALRPIAQFQQRGEQIQAFEQLVGQH